MIRGKQEWGELIITIRYRPHQGPFREAIGDFFMPSECIEVYVDLLKI